MRVLLDTRTLLWLVALCAALLAGCDPGYTYHVTAGQNQQIGDVYFDMRSPWGTLVGSGAELQTLTITNGSDQDVVILGADLVTYRRVIEAELPGSGELKWRTVPPGATESPFLYFGYGKFKDAEDVLTEQIRWNWRVQIEGEERIVSFTMKRE